MKNIAEYLGVDSDNITLYHKNGEKAIEYVKIQDGFSYERTYCKNGNMLTYKESRE